MSKKILTALAPMAAIVAFMGAPSLANATQVQCGGIECANGATFRVQSSNFQTTTQSPTGDLSCTGVTFEGTLTENQVKTIEGSITLDTLSGCVTNGVSVHIRTNASAAAPWKLQIQEPEGSGAGETPGQVTAHIDPASGSSLKLTDQIQVFGGSVATCVFSGSTVQLMGTEQEDTFIIEGKEQFTLVERSGIAAGECGAVNTTVGDLTATLQLETVSGGKVVVHGS